jgi:hypothetical protein
MATMLPYKDGALRIAHSNDASNDPVRAELAAMQAIADAMTRLSEESRRRVAEWAGEHFGGAVKVASPPPAPRTVTPATGPALDDTALAVADLEDFFERRPDEADLTLIGPEEGCALEPAPATAADDQPVVSMIHGFVEEFQKLARDWESA